MKVTGIEILVVVVIIAMVFAILTPFLPFGIPIKYSDGERAGTITKFSQKGLIWKTWEGEMVLGGVMGSTNVSANTWQFSVPKDRLDEIEAIRKAQVNGDRITLGYIQWVKMAKWKGDTNYMILHTEISKEE